MPPKENHEDFMENLGKDSRSFSTAFKCAAEFKRRRDSVEKDGLSVSPKDATADEKCQGHAHPGFELWRRDLRSTASEVGICFGAVQ